MGCDIHPYAEVRRNGKWERADVEVPSDRNYWTFSILAGVRNGHGFAGVYTGEPVRPIAQPRGLPIDCTYSSPDSDVGYGEAGYYWLGDHSWSWVTLSELLAYDLDRANTEGGIITDAQQKALKENGTLPDSWCGGTNRMEGRVHATWQRPLRECAWLMPKIIEALKPLGDPDDVRLVFGFDS